MFSNLNIITIFVEALCCIVFFYLAAFFLLRFFWGRNFINLFFGLFGLSTFSYVIIKMLCQFALNAGAGNNLLVFFQKAGLISLVVSTVFLWFFGVEKYQLKKGRFFSVLILFVAVVFICLVGASSVKLIYYKQNIEPVINLSFMVPAGAFFSLICLILSFFSIEKVFSSRGGIRGLAIYSTVAFLFFPLVFFLAYFYVNFGGDEYLLSAWFLGLFMTFALTSPEYTSPEIAVSWVPLKTYHAHILFKLAVVFALLIVVPYVVTALVTVNISKGSMSRAMKADFLMGTEKRPEGINKEMANSLSEASFSEICLLENRILFLVISAIFLTAIPGFILVNSIERPITRLTEGAEAVARGELGFHVEVDTGDEIGKLAENFNKMIKDLRESQERLIISEKLASLGTMAAGMAHEIRNPLVSLRTFTQLLQQKWQDKDFREKFSSIIPKEIERINRIAESLLKFGRPAKPEMTNVNVNNLLEDVLLLFESESKKNNVRVTKKMADLPEIAGDPGLLSQALINIIKNAIESMQSKGGELVVKTDVGEVSHLGNIKEGIQVGEEMIWGEEEELSNPVPAVFIEITDSGEGIEIENMIRLFDPFFTTKVKGTGMGLPITLRIIEEHKGSIKVRSKKGKGTSFIITLPQRS